MLGSLRFLVKDVGDLWKRKAPAKSLGLRNQIPRLGSSTSTYASYLQASALTCLPVLCPLLSTMPCCLMMNFTYSEDRHHKGKGGPRRDESNDANASCEFSHAGQRLCTTEDKGKVRTHS